MSLYHPLIPPQPGMRDIWGNAGNSWAFGSGMTRSFTSRGHGNANVDVVDNTNIPGTLDPDNENTLTRFTTRKILSPAEMKLWFDTDPEVKEYYYHISGPNNTPCQPSNVSPEFVMDLRRISRPFQEWTWRTAIQTRGGSGPSQMQEYRFWCGQRPTKVMREGTTRYYGATAYSEWMPSAEGQVPVHAQTHMFRSVADIAGASQDALAEEALYLSEIVEIRVPAVLVSWSIPLSNDRSSTTPNERGWYDEVRSPVTMSIHFTARPK